MAIHDYDKVPLIGLNYVLNPVKNILVEFIRYNEFNGGVFLMKRVSYSEEIKWNCIKLKEKGWSNHAIMAELNIRNRTQIHTWWRWYSKGETHRQTVQGVPLYIWLS